MDEKVSLIYSDSLVTLLLTFIDECVLVIDFFFNDTAPTEIYTLSLHDALPIFRIVNSVDRSRSGRQWVASIHGPANGRYRCQSSIGADAVNNHDVTEHAGSRCGQRQRRSEEHTSELQSQSNLVCRLLLEKKKKK